MPGLDEILLRTPDEMHEMSQAASYGSIVLSIDGVPSNQVWILLRSKPADLGDIMRPRRMGVSLGRFGNDPHLYAGLRSLGQAVVAWSPGNVFEYQKSWS